MKFMMEPGWAGPGITYIYSISFFLFFRFCLCVCVRAHESVDGLGHTDGRMTAAVYIQSSNNNKLILTTHANWLFVIFGDF